MTFVDYEQRDTHKNKLEEMTDKELKKEEKAVYYKCTDMLHRMVLLPEKSTHQLSAMRLMVSFLSLYVDLKSEIEGKK